MGDGKNSAGTPPVRVAHCIHHTHWDPIWYFSAFDADIAFAYNFRQLLDYFETNRVDEFFLDGQSAAIQTYLRAHPEDLPAVQRLARSGRLAIGPFHSQLDCFISNGESVINNLRLGMNAAKEYGGVSRVAYLPDSFGHSYDFPKIFNLFNVEDFVVTRGVGEPYDLRNEFWMASNDGSRILVATLLAGYGYGTYAFRDGTLLTEAAEDYNRISVASLIDRLAANSSLPGEFVLPLGFDQNPAIPDLADRFTQYNSSTDEYRFVATTWADFLRRVREQAAGLQDFRGELYSTQYHRMHRSLFSTRADIKTVQDRAERELGLVLQPVMCLLDHLGVPFDRALVDGLWEKLIRCQTHSSATMTDGPNRFIAQQSAEVWETAHSLRVYLTKKLARSLDVGGDEGRCVVVNTLPYRRSGVSAAVVYTREPSFRLLLDGDELDTQVVDQTRGNSGVRRKDPSAIDHTRDYYRTEVLVDVPELAGVSFRSLTVEEQAGDPDGAQPAPAAQRQASTKPVIENEFLRVSLEGGSVHLHDKSSGRTIVDALVLEDSGDEGDNYDYSYPDQDLFLRYDWAQTRATVTTGALESRLSLTGRFEIPRNLESRAAQTTDGCIDIDLELVVQRHSPLLMVRGGLTNQAENHRVRLLVNTGQENEVSHAGTQFSVITRPCRPPELDVWRAEGWFEEPSPQYPLLNHVSSVGQHGTVTCYTHSVKEYEFTGEGCSQIALVVYRSVGHLGLPDLNRRPGRPSGLDYTVLESPDSQLLGERIVVEFAVGVTDDFDPNRIFATYTTYSAPVVLFQEQQLDKAAEPILYFPMNPEDAPFPTSASLVEVGADVPFSTLTKADTTNGYSLRVFNAHDHQALPIGLDTAGTAVAVTHTDLEERVLGDHTSKTELSAGELINLNLKWRTTP